MTRLIDSFGRPGGDDRLRIRRPFIVAFAPGLGMIIVDSLERPRLSQVIVRDTTTGLRHAIAIPTRFGDRRSKTFRALGTDAARVRAAIGWTFYFLSPGDYDPDIEA